MVVFTIQFLGYGAYKYSLLNYFKYIKGTENAQTMYEVEHFVTARRVLNLQNNI